MTPSSQHARQSGHAALGVLAALLATGALAPTARALSTDDCLGCHANDHDSVVKLADGSSFQVFVDPRKWKSSVHGGKLACTDCHLNITDYPHPAVTATSARAFELAQGQSCKRCHFAFYTRMLDGIHYKLLEAGNEKAPTCVDCHGAHAITNPQVPRLSITQRCAKCHRRIVETFKKSVHGEALVDGNPDVPVCTDCHGAHDIHDPTRPAFHTASYELCAKCHADEKRMAKYGLSPAVVTTYLQDFHGHSNHLYQMGAGRPGRPMATCTDCHGVHDIQAVEKGQTRAEMQARIIQRCRRCHDNAPLQFASAWMFHYEPTLSKAPLVWAIKWAYRFIIPTIVLGLVLHILLHLFRVRTHR